MSVLTAETRQLIRDALDARARLVANIDRCGRPRCSECDGEHDNWTLGCRTCCNRHNRKAREGRHPHPNWFAARKADAKSFGEATRKMKQTQIMSERRQSATRTARIR